METIIIITAIALLGVAVWQLTKLRKPGSSQQNGGGANTINNPVKGEKERQN